MTGYFLGYGFIEYKHEEDFVSAFYSTHRQYVDGAQILVDFMRNKTMPGWVPRRFGGGIGGKKQSGQMRFGGRDCPFRALYTSINRNRGPGNENAKAGYGGNRNSMRDQGDKERGGYRREGVNERDRREGVNERDRREGVNERDRRENVREYGRRENGDERKREDGNERDKRDHSRKYNDDHHHDRDDNRRHEQSHSRYRSRDPSHSRHHSRERSRSRHHRERSRSHHRSHRHCGCLLKKKEKCSNGGSNPRPSRY